MNKKKGYQEPTMDIIKMRVVCLTTGSGTATEDNPDPSRQFNYDDQE